MPEAGASRATERKELKTLEDGYVVLRKMNYGEILHRRDISAQMSADRADQNVNVKLQFLAVQQYEFSKCIVEHNLTHDGTAFNFKEAKDVALLDPVVAQEIENYIDAMNMLPGEETAKFPTGSPDGSSAGETSLGTHVRSVGDSETMPVPPRSAE